MSYFGIGMSITSSIQELRNSLLRINKSFNDKQSNMRFDKFIKTVLDYNDDRIKLKYFDFSNEDPTSWDDFVDWLLNITSPNTRWDNSFIKKLGRFIKEELYYRSTQRYFDKDVLSIYDFFYILKDPKKSGGISYQPLISIKNEISEELDDIINDEDYNSYKEMITIKLTHETIYIYDRGKEHISRNDFIIGDVASAISNFTVVQISDVIIPSLRMRVIALSNYIKDGLEIKPSKYKNAGMGLFATRSFDKHERLTPYGGVKSARNTSEGLPLNKQSRYVYRLTKDPNNNKAVDSERFFKLSEKGRWSNHPIANDKSNSDFYEDDNGNVFLEAIIPIKKGDEILTNYGGGYGNVVGFKIRNCIVCGKTKTNFIDLETKFMLCSEKCQHKLYRS